ncbi:putative signal transducing protein [Candidatus Bipolaricaulota sp. J31]
MDERFVPLTVVWGEMEAALLIGFLEGEGIPARKRTQVPPSVYPFTVDGLAEVEILVPEHLLPRAREALEAFKLKRDG